MARLLTIIFFLTANSVAVAAPEFHYEDLRRFNQALEEIAAGEDTIVAMQGYVDEASPAFHAFAERYQVTAESIAEQYEKRPIYYSTLPKIEEWMKAQEESIEKGLAKLVSLSPAGEAAPVYFLVADQKAGGTPVPTITETGMQAAVAVAVDVIAITEDTDMSEFPDGPGGRAQRSDLPQVVVHENVHVLQISSQGGLDQYRSIYSPETGNMLAVAVREGCSEYLTYLAAGWQLGDRHIYFAEHEAELWKAFEPVINEPPFSVPGWFGGTHPDYSEWPSQIGYSLGFGICRHHHESAEDKDAAIHDLFSLYAPADVLPMAEAYGRSLTE